MAETKSPSIAQNADSISGADHEAAITAAYAESFAAARAEAFEEGVKLGYADELARVRAIFELPEAQGRQALALVLATETEVEPETAARILTAFPTTTRATASVPPLEERGAAPLH